MPISAARSVGTARLTTASSPDLGVGDFGASVTQVQQLLQRAGVATGPIDGDFGPMTQAAVRRFQASRGLPVDGVVGAQWLARKLPVCPQHQSTSVVLPWSTWAMMATLRTSLRSCFVTYGV